MSGLHARRRARRRPFAAPLAAPLALAAAAALAACGGGGDGGSGFGFANDGGASVGGGGGGGGLNAGAAGHLVYGSFEFERYLYHDVATGERGPVPDGASYEPHPTATGETAGVDDAGRVVIRGPDGGVTGGFDLPVETFRATLSPDATIVAAYVEDAGPNGFGTLDTVAFLERDGTIIYVSGGCRDVLWLPDGRAMLACDDEILVDDDVRGDAPLRTVASFPGSLRPDWLVLDPSGTRVAFELNEPGSSLPEAVVARMNVDGSDLVRMTASSILFSGDEPTWSPDGQWIGFRRAVYRSPYVIEECPVLMAARVDAAVGVALDDVVERGASVGGVILVRHSEGGRDGVGTPDGAACADTPPVWLP